MNNPHGIAVDGEGRVYVGDTREHWIQVFKRVASSG
ncbi:MAG: hypothetical protein DSY41_02250 [Candidatus Poseidoniales archaeon]|nr:hypothetical protein [SAR324 cluster bacterium]MQG27099.1 hypothetical protein [SAR202 cluster bacterium]PCJ70133.1 MAG: hypothetical protein COA56_16930 [Dehalococcoidia bacterium]RTZ95361.1 MAG: hypothetical protein DSY41_02250 [Candidatus Poseidoniales archaeon]MBL4737609.1 hypothetical protein [SAR324 cluster bacterium]